MELHDLLENFKTENDMQDACKKEWCVSPISGKVQQVALAPKGKKYQYACRYAVAEGAVAIVGYGFPASSSVEVEKSVNTGIMASVQEILSTLTIKKANAVEVDYIFNQGANKKAISQCQKFLSYGEEDYGKTLQFDKMLSPIRPIHYAIQRILSAASILAFPAYASPEAMQAAQNAIFEDVKMSDKMNQIEGPREFGVGVDLTDVQVCDPDIEKVFSQIEEQCDWFSEGEMGLWNEAFDKFAALESVNEFIRKYAHIGAVAIMVRGGFLNLLKAYLSANPPIAEFHAHLCELLAGATHTEAYDALIAHGK